MNPVVSRATRFVSHPDVAPTGTRELELTGASEQSFFVGLLARGPNTLRYCNAAGPPVGVVVTLAGAPSSVTEAIVGVGPVDTVVANAFPAFHPSKYRKMPMRAHGVKTVKLVNDRCSAWFISYRTKKKVLFLTIGPPKLAVPWLVLF